MFVNRAPGFLFFRKSGNPVINWSNLYMCSNASCMSAPVFLWQFPVWTWITCSWSHSGLTIWHYASEPYAVIVCPSVCLSLVSVQLKWLNVGSFKQCCRTADISVPKILVKFKQDHPQHRARVLLTALYMLYTDCAHILKQLANFVVCVCNTWQRCQVL